MQNTNAQNIREDIEKHGKDTAFWNTFDTYSNILMTDTWKASLSLLPEPVRKIADMDGFDTHLDFVFFPLPSFFGLSLHRATQRESEIYNTYCNGEAQTAYEQCLHLLEVAMSDDLTTDPAFEDFKNALQLANTDAPVDQEETDAELLALLMSQRQMNQKAVAKFLGMSQSGVSQILRGKNDLSGIGRTFIKHLLAEG